MAFVVKVGEAKTRLSELLHRVEAGEEIVLSRGPVPVARLAPIDPGHRHTQTVAETLEARDRGEARPTTAAELGEWGALDAGAPTGDRAVPAPRPCPAAALRRAIVLEPSFAAAWLIPGPDRAIADAAAARLHTTSALAAPGFWTGLADLLLVAHRRGRVEAGFAGAQLARAGRLPITEIALTEGLGVETESEARAALLRLALAHGLSIHDASYLAAARAGRLPLATNRPALARAAAREGLDLLTDFSDADRA